MADTANTFSGVKAMLKDSYGKKKACPKCGKSPCKC